MIAIKELKPMDLLAYFRDSLSINQSNFTKIYWKNDAHFNGTVYQLLGDNVARELAYRNILR